MGPLVAAFEDAFALYHGKRHAIMVNSGSSANLVGVAALFYKKHRPLRRGDEVIVPALSWSTTYHPLQQYGLRLRIVDIDLETLNLDAGSLEQALSPRTRLIVGVNVLGNPGPLDAIRALADAHGLYFLEDNCESLDAELGGRKTGTFGDLASFSFFFSHHISTVEGGMVLTDNDELADLMRSLRAHGWTRDLPAGTDLFEAAADDRFETYRFILPGYNLRPTELNAAVGLEQLKKLPAMTRQRRKNLARFQELFGDDPRFIVQRDSGTSSSFAFTIILNPDRIADRERVFGALRQAGIGFRLITGGCVLRHEVVRYYDYEIAGEIRNAAIAHDCGFFVGNHPFDLGPQLERLHDVLDRTCG